MSASSLNESFGLPGLLQFEDAPGLTRARITLPSCNATVYLHGAHLTHWQPAGYDPVLFLSGNSDFAPGKPIRGGIPVCWPWFGADGAGRGPQGKPGPSHGFARLQEWDLTFAALLPAEGPGDALRLTFSLLPSDLSRSFGFDHFRVVYEMTFGSALDLRLSVANLGTEPFRFEEALHTYFAVGDVRETVLDGLESATYLDKTDGMRQKRTAAGPLRFRDQTDSVFPANTSTTTIHDQVNHRDITIEKSQSATTVVWNPWAELAATLADLEPDSWPGFVCVETANARADGIALAPGEAHRMQARLSVAQR